MSNDYHKGWLGVDLDGTLAIYDGWKDGEIGKPVSMMLMRVKNVIKMGGRVKIMTARANDGDEAISKIQDWCEQNGLPRLEVTSKKDFQMIELWDDRAVAIQKNTGLFLSGSEYLRGL